CAGYSGAECEEERRPRRNAIVVLLRFAAGCNGARAAGAFCGAESGMTMTGISGAAAARAADAMLRTLGGTEVILLFPAAGLPGDPVAGLGLVDPGVDQGSIAPVVVVELTTENSGPRRRIELLAGQGAL